MLFTECDTRKMEYCVDGDFYSVSTPPSSGYNLRQEIYDLIEQRLRLAFDNVEDSHNDYFAYEIIKSMYYQINEIGKLVEDIVNHDIMRSIANNVRPRTFINELNIIPGGSDADYARVADEVIRDAIANGMISTDITHFRNGTKQATVKTSGKDMSRMYDEDITERPVQESVEEVTKPVPKKKVRKFKIGERYLIYPMNNKKLRREFVVKKTIYSIKDREVNIVIMKQVSGSESTKFTLSKEDCLKFHLKFEEGLQVFSMELDWKLVKNK